MRYHFISSPTHGYLRVPSVMHYLIVEPGRRLAIHDRRGIEGLIETRIVSAEDLHLMPPGLTLALSDVFADL